MTAATPDEASVPSSPRVGRPRASGPAPPGDTREAILDAAAALFIDRGYAGTTTRDIASAVGLRQGSLAHYFGRKEFIFAELLSRTVEPAMAVVNAAGLQQAPPLERLAALILTDCKNLCSGDHNVARLQLLPEARADAFSSFWHRREQLRTLYGDLIRAAREAGEVAMSDVHLATDACFGMVESVIIWFDRSGPSSAEAAATCVARAVLGALLVDPTRAAEAVTAAWEATTVTGSERSARQTRPPSTLSSDRNIMGGPR